jgi:hypothetical protein
VAGAAFGDLRCDVALLERSTVLSAVVGAGGEQRLRAELAVAAGRRYAIDKRDQLGDVVAVGSGERRPAFKTNRMPASALVKMLGQPFKATFR